MQTIVLALVAVVCAAAAVVWVRSARLRLKMVRHVESQSLDPNADSRDAFVALKLTRAGFRKDAHNVVIYTGLTILFAVMAFTGSIGWSSLALLILIPAIMSISWYSSNKQEVRFAEERFEIEKRAEETLAQEQLAPREWAGRLAPDQLPDFTGFEVGRVYQAGSGLMAGDFFDVYRVAPTRIAAVIGDVAGKGISASITAFQAKYLLRVFLRQFRDPAQALEELNAQMSQ